MDSANKKLEEKKKKKAMQELASKLEMDFE
jgi:hypothetical protein